MALLATNHPLRGWQIHPLPKVRGLLCRLDKKASVEKPDEPTKQNTQIPVKRMKPNPPSASGFYSRNKADQQNSTTSDGYIHLTDEAVAGSSELLAGEILAFGVPMVSQKSKMVS